MPESKKEVEKIDWKLLSYYLSMILVGGFIILIDVGPFIRLIAVSLLIALAFSSSTHIITRKTKKVD